MSLKRTCFTMKSQACFAGDTRRELLPHVPPRSHDPPDCNRGSAPRPLVFWRCLSRAHAAITAQRFPEAAGTNLHDGFVAPCCHVR